jgi:hypothetical protein
MRPTAPLVAVVLCLLLAGCAGAGTPASTTDSTTTTVSDSGSTTTTEGQSTTTEDCPPYANLSERDLPERPTTLDAAGVRDYVTASEEATVWNDLIEERKISLGVHASNTTVVARPDDGYLLRVEGGFGFEDCLNGSHVAGDGVLRTNYFVNDTVVLRDDDPESLTDDPRDGGTVVERWS